jgi:hypothetical protein
VPRLFKAIVITPTDKTVDFGSYLAIARNEARKREQCVDYPTVRAVHFIPEVGAYVAIYEVPDKVNANQTKRAIN